MRTASLLTVVLSPSREEVSWAGCPPVRLTPWRCGSGHSRRLAVTSAATPLRRSNLLAVTSAAAPGRGIGRDERPRGGPMAVTPLLAANLSTTALRAQIEHLFDPRRKTVSATHDRFCTSFCTQTHVRGITRANLHALFTHAH